MEIKPNITDFSHELLCQILQYLPLREILSVAMLCKKMLAAVDMHLQLCKSIDFCQDSNFGYMPSTITDDHLLTLLKKCPHLEIVYGLHPVKIERRRLRKRAALTIPGIIEALSLCFHLKAIETSDLRLFEAIMQHLPQLEIIGHFQNRNGLFPPQASQRLKLQPYPRISSLHLIGVEVPELTAMPHLQHLHLQCVRFTKLQPFRAFLAQNLKSFVMKHCIGPSVPQRYLSLIIALSSSPNLSHLELVRVPLLNGLFQRAVEDSYRHNGFVNLRTLVISGCKGILEADLGHLMIVSSKNLKTLYIQPSLTKDSLFVSLSFAQCSFPVLHNLHLGYIDNLNFSGEWSNDTLLSFGLAEVPDTPSSITDSGMKVISQLFPHIRTLSVSNCPHLMVMYQWKAELDNEAWTRLTDLTLQKCHCLQLSSFVHFISQLSNIQVIILNEMFREPPKGCSHVGLSAGTGLGMSSAVVSNQDEHIAVQGHHQEFEPPGDEENEEIDREFPDVEIEDNPEPQFMVLQRDFFDGEDNDRVVVNPPLENDQDANVENEELNITFNEGNNNNSLPNENIVVSDKNNILDGSFSSLSSVSDKCVSSEVFTYEDLCPIIRKSNRKKLNSSDSMRKGILLQDNCNSSNFTENSCIKGDTYNNECCISENGNKTPTVPKILHEYDPHKPSTSKAGSHLDYSDCNDDYKFSKGTKRSNMCLNDQNLYKKQKKSLKVINDNEREEKSRKDGKISPSNSFESNLNMNNDFKDINYSNYVKEESIENTSWDAQKNLDETPVSFNIDKIPTTMRCYVHVEKIEIKTNPKISISHDKNEEGNRIVKVDKDKLSKNASYCDYDKYKTTLNDMRKNVCAHVMPLKNNNIDVYSEQHYPFIKIEDECSHLNDNEFNFNCQANATSDDYSSEVSEPQINDNVCNTSISKSNHKTPINCFPVANIDFTDPLLEKNLEINDVNEFSEYKVLLEDSSNESTTKTVHKTENNTISSFKKATINADKLLSSCEETPSVSRIEDKFFKKKILDDIQLHSVTTCYNSVATQTYENDFSDNDSNAKINSANENKEPTMKKSLEIFISDLHKSDENSFTELRSEKIKISESPESSNIIKPCCVLVTKTENIESHLIKYSDEESKKYKKETSCDNIFEQSAYDYFPTLNENENSLKRQNFEMCTPLLMSTSKSGTDICDDSGKYSRTFKKMHPPKYFKTTSLVNRKSKKAHFATAKESSESEVENCSTFETQSIKNAIESNSHNEISNCNIELPSHDLNGLKEPSKVDSSDGNNGEDSKFYVLMPNNSTFEIINSVTGKSYEIPQCHVLVTPVSNKSSDNSQKTSPCNDIQKQTISKESFVERCDNNLEFNPYFPSTTRTGNHLNNSSEGVTYLNDNCKVREKMADLIKCTKCETSSKCCCNHFVPCNFNAKKLHIKNSDAMILLKHSSTKKNSKYDSYQQISCELSTNDTSKFENGAYNSCQEQKFETQSNSMPVTENPSFVYKTADSNVILENNQSTSTFEKKKKSKYCIHMKKRKRKRKIIIPSKRIKKSLNDSKVKINNSFQDVTKNNAKRTSLPMISLISQGTQATSADIRRSIKRIRRAASHKKTPSSVCRPKGRCSNKISSKTVTKRPVSMVPRPESCDKATSTSDPLLEDDAIQTLELSSRTLVSFTMVSCGISDLIIDQCIMLFHIEVQACRILKRFQFNNCPSIKRLNVSQCPKLNITALASPVMSLPTYSYFLVSYEPCMQGYHPGEGEKAILAKASINQSVLLLHDFCDISYDNIQGKFREKILGWLRFLSQLHLCLNYTQEHVRKKKYKSEIYQLSEYPWSHDLRRIHGHYTYSSTSDFCDTEGRYQILTNNPIFCDLIETNQLDIEFPDIKDCDACRDLSLLSYEVIEKYLEMKKKFVAFYIPVTENNQINF